MNNNNNSTHPIGRLFDALEGRYVQQFALMQDGLILLPVNTYLGDALHFVPADTGRYILERCIGHLDSQGKWIFEGDVVEKACGKGVVTPFYNIWKVVAKNGYSHTGIVWEDWTITGTSHDEGKAR